MGSLDQAVDGTGEVKLIIPAWKTRPCPPAYSTTRVDCHGVSRGLARAADDEQEDPRTGYPVPHRGDAACPARDRRSVGLDQPRCRRRRAGQAGRGQVTLTIGVWLWAVSALGWAKSPTKTLAGSKSKWISASEGEKAWRIWGRPSRGSVSSVRCRVLKGWVCRRGRWVSKAAG